MENPLIQIEKSLFDAALDIEDPDLRNAFLEQTCRGNPDMQARLEALLAAHSTSETFFDINVLQAVGGGDVEEVDFQPPPSNELSHKPEPESDFAENSNTWIGRYKLAKRLGYGGCGVVYAAEQQEPVQRQVALKIIRLGMNTERIIARFDVERRALALMNHPNIAHVLDAGATKSGRPYFVMELVPGKQITDYCDEHRLSIEERLGLFIQVCLAIQHAHQKGILHLDIKPSNVLITLKDGTPVPKVIDFGIGKAIEGPLANGAALATPEQFVGTPAYMSPEQAAGAEEDIDTRSDIYSLGALLYELLTGRPPFDTAQMMGAGTEGMRQILLESDPPLPSVLLRSLCSEEVAAIAERRRCSVPVLIASLRNDLDWIVKQAMEKDRHRRYPTANGMAADVRRYLQSLPVSAHPASSLYSLRKLVRRNWLVFVSAAAVLLTLVAGLSTSTWLFFREREALEQEARLRVSAEDGENLLRAMALVREGDFDGSDKLLQEIKTPLTKPSLDGESAYRFSGDALAAQGRWREAAERYAVLLRIDALSPWGRLIMDYQSYGAVLMEGGDIAGYESFRHAAIAKFSASKVTPGAPSILETCLLAPVDKQLQTQLQLLADENERLVAALGAKALTGDLIPGGLWRYRIGDYNGAIKYMGRNLDAPNPVLPQNVASRLITGMSLARMGQIDEARSLIVPAGGVIEAKFSWVARGPRRQAGFDWMLAQILLHEATVLIGGKMETAGKRVISSYGGLRFIGDVPNIKDFKIKGSPQRRDPDARKVYCAAGYSKSIELPGVVFALRTGEHNKICHFLRGTCPASPIHSPVFDEPL